MPGFKEESIWFVSLPPLGLPKLEQPVLGKGGQKVLVGMLRHPDHLFAIVEVQQSMLEPPSGSAEAVQMAVVS